MFYSDRKLIKRNQQETPWKLLYAAKKILLVSMDVKETSSVQYGCSKVRNLYFGLRVGCKNSLLLLNLSKRRHKDQSLSNDFVAAK
jgi:hypothetical protein